MAEFYRKEKYVKCIGKTVDYKDIDIIKNI